ncbi:hypothetical protein INO26_13480, partial [Staphylococcus aureus]|nr:hypothetical protein [Staphylococcus aureus]
VSSSTNSPMSALDQLNEVIAKNGLETQVGGTGQLGKTNPALNILSGNKTIANLVSSKGLDLTPEFRRQLAQELLATNDNIPSFFQDQMK